MATSRAVAAELDQILTHLYERGVLHFWNSVSETSKRVSWNTSRPFEEFLSNRDAPTVQGYMYWLERGMYSAVMTDGSLLQVTYEFEGGEIVGHRLAFIPCPVVVNHELLEEGVEMLELVELQLAEPREVLMRSAIRFDYDPENAGPGHPSSHLTINGSDCRIACASPLRLGRFLDFVFRHFYPALHDADPVLKALPKDGWFNRTIGADDVELMHFSWPA